MLEEILIPALTAVGSAGLGYYLCRVQARSELNRLETRFQEQAKRLKRQCENLKAKVELTRAQAQRDEARQMVLMLASGPPPPEKREAPEWLPEAQRRALPKSLAVACAGQWDKPGTVFEIPSQVES
jgi:hypothetical protein